MEEKKQIETMSIGQLAALMKESTANGQNFCFILGSGASLTSGIPLGRDLERRWMDCLMGDAPDGDSPAKKPEETEKLANKLFSENIIETPFDKLKSAWEKSKKTGKHIPSEYYFDIYKLRFYPERRNGYKYLEKLMENAKPSVGYHPLARLLAGENGIDIVITTNFDSLIEDSLFIFTEERPLVAAHESLADYIDLSRKQRPVVAKVHRGLFYAPMNERETTSDLSEGWKDALSDIFSRYTPIVIGYAGGDKSLMSFLKKKSTRLSHGLYWCLMQNEEPGDKIKKLVTEKGGQFVRINGFDDAMLTIGEAFLGDSIIPAKTIELLNKSAEDRGIEYDNQWKEWKKRREGENPEHNEAISKLEKAETAERHMMRGFEAESNGNYAEAVTEFTKAIETAPDSYDIPEGLGPNKHIRPIQARFNNRLKYYLLRSYSYSHLGDYTKALEDSNIVIAMEPDFAGGYCMRGFANEGLSEYSKAIENHTKAIDLSPDYSYAYCRRASAYIKLNMISEAKNDLVKAIELIPDYAESHRLLANLYDKLGDTEKALEELSKAILFDCDYVEAYRDRAAIYRKLGSKKKALADEKLADEIEGKNKKN